MGGAGWDWGLGVVVVCVCVRREGEIIGGVAKNILEIYAGVFKCAEFMYLCGENCLTPISKLEFNSNLRWMALEMAHFLLVT